LPTEESSVACYEVALLGPPKVRPVKLAFDLEPIVLLICHLLKACYRHCGLRTCCGSAVYD